MNSNIESLNHTIASWCAAVRPERWDRCEAIYCAVHGYAFAELAFYDGDREIGLECPDAVSEAFEQLRPKMAAVNGNQAWYTAVFRMTPDGKYAFDFDYDHLPGFDFLPNKANWQREFAQYPRPELQAQVQAWMDADPSDDAMHDKVLQYILDLLKADGSLAGSWVQ